MIDLNAISDFSNQRLPGPYSAKAINDLSFVVGDGIASDGSKHAFLLTPRERVAVREAPVREPTTAIGQWTYVHNDWVWIDVGGGWWWEGSDWNWHGSGSPPHHPPKTPPTTSSAPAASSDDKDAGANADDKDAGANSGNNDPPPPPTIKTPVLTPTIKTRC